MYMCVCVCVCVSRYKNLEEKLFAEKEDLCSKYETILEEKAKLSKVRLVFVCPYFTSSLSIAM